MYIKEFKRKRKKNKTLKVLLRIQPLTRPLEKQQDLKCLCKNLKEASSSIWKYI